MRSERRNARLFTVSDEPLPAGNVIPLRVERVRRRQKCTSSLGAKVRAQVTTGVLGD